MKSTFQEVLEGLQILAKYGDQEMCAGHDQILCGSFSAHMDDADREAMKALGWMEDEGAWMHFV